MPKALILIDLQNDYFPGGAMELDGILSASSQAADLLARFRRAQLPIIHIRHLSLRPGATFFLPDTRGADLHASVYPESGEIVIEKHFPNAFLETTLQDTLNSLHVTELVLCGAMSHMCVDSTVRAAADMRYSCTVAHDACATRALSFNAITVPASEVHAAFMSGLSSFARIVEARQVEVE